MKCYKYSLNSQILSKRAMGQLNWGYNSEFTLTPKCLQFSDPKSPKRSLPNQRVTWEYDDSPVDLAGFTMVFHQFFRQSHISYDHKVWDQMLLYFPYFPYGSHMFHTFSYISHVFSHVPNSSVWSTRPHQEGLALQHLGIHVVEDLRHGLLSGRSPTV